VSVRVQREDFDLGEEVRRLTAGRTDIGAIVTFAGMVRGDTSGAAGGISQMTLEHYPGMTEEELARVEAEAAARWPLQASLIVHRIGTLRPGDNIVLVVTASAHRQAAFDAAAFLMDYLKTRAPFWKKELDADGEERWVDARESDDVAAERWRKPQSLRRFDVELFIVHPTLAPAEISAALGLEAAIAHCVGEPRRTPEGTPLSGTYPDTRWRHSVRYEVRADVDFAHFADKVADLVDRLEPHKAFLHRVRADGGRAELIVQFLEGYVADDIPPSVLGKLADLRLDLGIESYGVPQP
jgi:molybdopterin synthase catalytic subunit